MASNSALSMASRSGASRRGRQVVWYRPDMVNGAVAYFAPDSGRAGRQVREFSEEAVDRIAASDGLYAWDL
jgi:hypothetical protein